MVRILHLMVVFVFVTVCGFVNAEQQVTYEDIKQAAEQGDALAQAQYGSIYFLGENFQLQPNARFKTKQKFKAIAYLLKGVSKDDDKAAEWILRSAKQGYVDAEVFIAALYDRGMGVKQSEQQATEFYKKASAHGNEMATAVLGPYARSRMRASKDVPTEYSLKILNTQ